MVKQSDNSVAAVASNCYGVTPACKAERIGTAYGKRMKIQVYSPYVIQKHNECTGGVDRFDETVDCFRVVLRSKKWWFPLFTFGIETVCQNAWHLVKNSDAGKDFTYCQFRRAVVETYCGLFGQPPKKEGNNAPMGIPVPREVRQNLEQHAGVDCSERRC
jgi:hypothetical protein